MSSQLKFNETTSEFRSNWTDIDFYNLFQDFFQGEVTFRVITYIPGSDQFGLDENTDLEMLTSATFMIKFLDGTVVDECADNSLSLSPFTKYGYIQRGDTVDHQIAPSGESSSLIIRGLQVVGTKPNCQLVTEVYYWDNHRGEHTSARRMLSSRMNTDSTGSWELAVDNEAAGFSINYDEAYATWVLNQTFYIDSLVKNYGPVNVKEGYVPEAVKINISIYTFDPTNMNANVTDNFTLEIFGNGDSASDVCNFTTLVISKPFNNRVYNYTVGTNTRRRNLQGYPNYDYSTPNYNNYDQTYTDPASTYTDPNNQYNNY
jgi:hypothetical protein